MNKYFLFFILSISTCYAQPGQWTWLKGDSIPNSVGSFGIQGVSASTNEPPSVYEPAEFTDKNGNFWFYGGLEYMSGSNVKNNLWKYDPVTNEWTWMKGTNVNNDPGTFGVQGIPAASNNPPGLAWGAATWVDTAGNFWMFGGALGNGGYGDLWKYDVQTNEWTWMKGSGVPYTSPVYGTQLVANASNSPGSRNEVSSTWVEGNDLWFFGGDYTGNGQCNDLWKYNITTNMWTWMKGNSAVYSPGHWGTINVENTLNVPSARFSYSHWTDTAGNFWMYGGSGRDAAGFLNELSDLWRYNKITNNWTWMNGSNTNLNPTYSPKCTADSLSTPGSRFENRAVWTDNNHDFWMFGGVYYLSSVTQSFNDLWKYCVAANKWIYISGDSISNTPGYYGTLGTSTQFTRPRDRYGAISWQKNNVLYVFGGTSISSNGPCNDLWKYEIDTNCLPCSQLSYSPQSIFTINDTALCEGSCINPTNQSINAYSYQWIFQGGTPSTDTSANPQNICYLTQGSYDITLITSNAVGTDTLILMNAITIYPPASNAPITRNGDTLFSVQGYSSYQWLYNSTIISSATNYYHVAMQNGDYSVQVTDSNGCVALATFINVITSTQNEINRNFDLTVIVTRTTVKINLKNNESINSEIQLFDLLGKQLVKRKIILQEGINEIDFGDVPLSAGCYFFEIHFKGQKRQYKVIAK